MKSQKVKFEIKWFFKSEIDLKLWSDAWSELKWNKRSYVGDKNGQIGHQHHKIAIASESEISYVTLMFE